MYLIYMFVHTSVCVCTVRHTEYNSSCYIAFDLALCHATYFPACLPWLLLVTFIDSLGMLLST